MLKIWGRRERLTGIRKCQDYFDREAYCFYNYGWWQHKNTSNINYLISAEAERTNQKCADDVMCNLSIAFYYNTASRLSYFTVHVYAQSRTSRIGGATGG